LTDKINGTLRSAFLDPKVWITLVVLIGQAAITWWRVGMVEQVTMETRRIVQEIETRVRTVEQKVERAQGEREAILDRLRRVETKL
jgi:CHASE1-domain containing sensor protein